MLKRARIQGYKSLWDAEITFTDPLTLIIGPNAAGKTNLLDALALLSRIVTLGSVKRAFTEGHRGSYLEAFSFGEEGLAGNLKNATREIRFEIDVELLPIVVAETNAEIERLKTLNLDEQAFIESPWLRYSIVLKPYQEGRNISILDETLQFIDENNNVTLSHSMFANDKIRGFVTYRPNAETPIPPGAAGVLVDESFISSTSPLSLMVASVFRNELARWSFYDLDPKKMLLPGTYIDTAILSADGHDLASFFDTMKARNPRQFAQMTRELRMIIPQIESFDVDIDEAHAEVDLAVREHGALFSANLLSEGTLRVLGMLAASSPMAPVSLIGLEEPENGIHPRRLALVAEHFRNLAERRGDRQQMLLTTHSPLLPGYLAPEQVVVCQRQGNRTTFIPLRNAGIFGLDDLDAPPDENGLTPTPLFERIVRGDYGG